MKKIPNPIILIAHTFVSRGEKDFKKALEKAHTFFDVIKNLIDSKKSTENKLASFEFITKYPKDGMLGDFVVKIKKRRGHFDFYAVTHDGKILDKEFLHGYENKNLRYDYHTRYYDNRYFLYDLRQDLNEINKGIPLIYVILISPKEENAFIFTLNQLQVLWSGNTIPSLEGYGEPDEVDMYYKRRSEIKNPCPACGDEWNGAFCHYCGWPN